MLKSLTNHASIATAAVIGKTLVFVAGRFSHTDRPRFSLPKPEGEIVELWLANISPYFAQGSLFQQDLYGVHMFHCYTSFTGKGFSGRTL